MAETPPKTDPKAPYTIRSSGFWTTRHEFSRDGKPLGTLTIRRGPLGRVQGGVYEPLEGQTITVDRDPGLLPRQYGCWCRLEGDRGREWLGSSIRYGLKREVSIHNGTKPFRLVPTPSFGTGWDLHAPKTGLAAQFRRRGRTTTITFERKVDFFLLLLAYQTIFDAQLSSIWPGQEPTPGIT